MRAVAVAVAVALALALKGTERADQRSAPTGDVAYAGTKYQAMAARIAGTAWMTKIRLLTL